MLEISRVSSIVAALKERNQLTKIALNVGWLALDSILRLCIGLTMTVLLARYLGPSQFGLLSYALAISALFAPIAKLGIENIVVRDITITTEEADHILGTTFGLRIAASIGVSFLCVFTATMLNSHELLAEILILLSICTVLRSSETIVLWFQSQVQSKRVVYVKISTLLIATAIQIVLIVNRAPLISFVWATLCEIVLFSVGLAAIYQWYGPGLNKLKFSMKWAKSLLSQGWPLILSSMSITMYMKVDQLMLGYILGEEAVGLYAAISRVSEAFYFIPIAVASSVGSALIAARDESFALYYRKLQQLFSLMVAIGGTLSVFVVFCSVPLISYLFSPLYLNAVPALNIHIWSSTFVFFGVIQGLWDVNENMQKLALVRVTVGSLTNICLNYLLIPFYGVLGAAIATLISYVLVNYVANALYPQTRYIFQLQSNAFILSGILPYRGKGDREP